MRLPCQKKHRKEIRIRDYTQRILKKIEASKSLSITELMENTSNLSQEIYFCKLISVKKKQGSQTVTQKGNLAVQRCWTSERVYQLIYKLTKI